MKYDSLVKSHPLVLVDFYATWCGPCKMMTPIFDQLKKELGDKVKVVKVDTEKNQRLSQKMSIKSVPTIILYRYGKIIWKKQGGIQLPELKKQIEKYL